MDSHASAAPARTFTVLTVDDSRLLHSIVGRYLSGSEFQMTGGALDGDEAMERVKELSPDVVLLDVVMPGLGGPETLDRILRWNRSARVVMASSVGTDESVHECLAAGARTFLIKPFTRDDLIASLRRAVADA